MIEFFLKSYCHLALNAQSIAEEAFELIPLDLCYEIFGLLTIQEVQKNSQAFPRTFGAVIESTPMIRFKNAINFAPSPLFHRVLGKRRFHIRRFDLG